MKRPNLRALLPPAGILLAALLAFGLTLRTGFMWDDHRMIEGNPRLTATAANLGAAFKGDPFGEGLNYYRPLQTVSNMADFALWGYRPFGYHLTNLLFHAAAALLFFCVALELGFGRAAAFWAAALLAAHPAAVEQLLVVAGRAELASGACILASLLLFLRGRAAASFLLFLAALGFKENGVITPALIALCLWYRRASAPEAAPAAALKRDALKLLPFFAALPLYLLARRHALGMGALPAAGPLLAGLCFKVPAAVLNYLLLAALPFGMRSHRMQPELPWLAWAALPLLAAGLWLLWRRRRPEGIFFAGWYLLNLAPKMPLLATNDLMLDHWVYLSNAGLFLWAAAFAPARRLLPAAALALALAAAVNVTRRDTDLKNYELAARASSSKPMLCNLAREYYLLGRLSESRAILERISAADPGNVSYLNGLALARWRTGDVPGALAALDRAQVPGPLLKETLYNRYCVLKAAGRAAEAEAALAAALKEDPAYPAALLARARAFTAAGRDAEAEAAYRALLRGSPADLEALNDYGVLLARRGDCAGARREFELALAAAPGLQSARLNLARLDALRGGAGARR